MLDNNGDKPLDCVHDTPWVRLVRSPLLLTVGWLRSLRSGCENGFYVNRCSCMTEFSSHFFSIGDVLDAHTGYLGLSPQAPCDRERALAVCCLSFAVAQKSESARTKKVTVIMTVLMRIYRSMSRLDEIVLKGSKKMTKKNLAERSVRLCEHSFRPR
jgi:hypothetical protein